MKTDPKSVIDKAIEENRAGEKILYFICLSVVAVGLAVLVYGAISNKGIVALSGGLSTSLIIPVFRSAIEIRRQNIAIRLLEEALNRATSSKEAAEAIKSITESFRKVFIQSKTVV